MKQKGVGRVRSLYNQRKRSGYCFLTTVLSGQETEKFGDLRNRWVANLFLLWSSRKWPTLSLNLSVSQTDLDFGAPMWPAIIIRVTFSLKFSESVREIQKTIANGFRVILQPTSCLYRWLWIHETLQGVDGSTQFKWSSWLSLPPPNARYKCLSWVLLNLVKWT
jgi:hypothetical protein